MVGSAARIRVSSVTLPSWSGTLKSTRTKTRLPAASRSWTVSLSMVGSSGSRALPAPSGSGPDRGMCSGEAVGDELREVRDAAAVAPLVVVPGDDLHEVASQHHVRREVDDGAAGVAAVVRGHQRLVARAEDPGERARCGVAERLVELLERDVLLELGREVDDRHGRRRDTQAEAVELALEVGDHERDG